MNRFSDQQLSAVAKREMRVLAAFATTIVSTLACAQSSPAVPPSSGDTGPPIMTWRITPEITVRESYSDNAALVPLTEAKKSWVTETTPSLRVEQTGVRTKFFFDFRLSDFRYTSFSALNNSQRLLTSYATVEALDNWFFVDASANITQQNRSAFSIAAAPNLGGPNGNRVETATNQLSPYIRGRLGGVATYQLRVVAADIRSNDIALPDTKGTQWTGFIKNDRATSGLGWSIDGNALSFRNQVVGRSHDARIRGSVSYEIGPQIHASAIIGREATNFSTSGKNSSNTSGIGLEWSPDIRTQVAAVKERRFFGDSHSISVSHRTPLSIWKITSNRDVTALSGQLTASGPGSTAGLLSDLLAASIPDPVAREAAVRQRLEDSGISASSASGGGFATGRPFLIRSDEASVAMRGVLNTITISVTRRDQRGLGPNLGGNDSFSLSNEIRQQGFNLNWAYRLSPLSTFSLVATSLRTEGLSVIALESRQRSLNLLFSTRLSPDTFFTFGARHVQFDNLLNTGYRENAILASVSFRY